MPEPNRPPPEPTYGYHALDTLRRLGITEVEFWCLACARSDRRPVAGLITKCGPGATLLTLARRARCGGCGRGGCHVQPAEPPALGTPHYCEWLRGELERCQAFISYGRGQL